MSLLQTIIQAVHNNILTFVVALGVLVHLGRVARWVWEYRKMEKTLGELVAKVLGLPRASVRVRCKVDWLHPSRHRASVTVDGKPHDGARIVLQNAYQAMVDQVNKQGSLR